MKENKRYFLNLKNLISDVLSNFETINRKLAYATEVTQNFPARHRIILSLQKKM
jgi:hypothetical protein